MIVAAIGYFFATLMRFAISRKREYWLMQVQQK